MKHVTRILPQLVSRAMSSPVASTSYLPPASAELLSSAQPTAVSTAASILQRGGLVAFPTETVYGLGACALSERAVRGIFSAKGRPRDNPLIVHVSSREMLVRMLPGAGSTIPKLYEPLMEAFWPGPLTLVFPLEAREGVDPPEAEVAESVLAGHQSLAVRWPAHPLALELIAQSNLPLAAPSANLSSRPSPTTAAHVAADLGSGRGVGAIVDGGPCEVGLESTVVDWVAAEDGLGEGTVRVLRAGGVGPEQLEECLERAGYKGGVQVWGRDFSSEALKEKPTTPGMKYKHYAPTNAKVILVQAVDGMSDEVAPSLASLLETIGGATTTKVGLMLSTETLAKLDSSLAPTSFSDSATPLSLPGAPPSLELSSYPLGRLSHPAEAASRLFAGLRYFDQVEGLSWVLVEAVEEAGVGIAVMERARKSAGGLQRGELERFRVD